MRESTPYSSNLLPSKTEIAIKKEQDCTLKEDVVGMIAHKLRLLFKHFHSYKAEEIDEKPRQSIQGQIYPGDFTQVLLLSRG